MATTVLYTRAQDYSTNNEIPPSICARMHGASEPNSAVDAEPVITICFLFSSRQSKTPYHLCSLTSIPATPSIPAKMYKLHFGIE